MKKRKKYSDFVQEKVFAMHESIMSYIDDIGNEEKFYDMEDMITRCRVAVPDKIYRVIKHFVTQYLEMDLYGDNDGKSNCCDFKEMYEGIAMEYIRPVLVV